MRLVTTQQVRSHSNCALVAYDVDVALSTGAAQCCECDFQMSQLADIMRNVRLTKLLLLVAIMLQFGSRVAVDLCSCTRVCVCVCFSCSRVSNCFRDQLTITNKSATVAMCTSSALRNSFAFSFVCLFLCFFLSVFCDSTLGAEVYVSIKRLLLCFVDRVHRRWICSCN